MRARPGRPGTLTGARSVDPDRLEALGTDRVDHPEGGRVRGDGAVQIDLIAKRSQIGQTADQIIDSIARYCTRINESGH